MRPGKVLNVVLAVLCLLLIAGLASVFAPCGPKDDGSFMSCHYAGLYSQAAAAILLAQSACALILGGRGRNRGIFISMLVIEAVMFFIPGTFVHLCMMPDMKCRMLMKPYIMVMDIIIAAVTAACIAAASADRNTSASAKEGAAS